MRNGQRFVEGVSFESESKIKGSVRRFKFFHLTRQCSIARTT